MEPESSTGPKKSRFKRDEPPLTAEPGGRPRLTERERAETCSSVSDQSRLHDTQPPCRSQTLTQKGKVHTFTSSSAHCDVTAEQSHRNGAESPLTSARCDGVQATWHRMGVSVWVEFSFHGGGLG